MDRILTGPPEIVWNPRGKGSVTKVKNLEKLKYKLLSQDAVRPTRSHDGDLGYDLYANEEVVIQPNEKQKVGTGVAFQFPSGWGGFVKDRSSMATKTDLETIGGVIDNGYIGELFIVFVNYGHEVQVIEKGQKIAQMVLIPVANFELEQVDQLIARDDRGTGGFGSTGK